MRKGREKTEARRGGMVRGKKAGGGVRWVK